MVRTLVNKVLLKQTKNTSRGISHMRLCKWPMKGTPQKIPVRATRKEFYPDLEELEFQGRHAVPSLVCSQNKHASPARVWEDTASVHRPLTANPRATRAQIPQFPSQVRVQNTRTRVFTATLAGDSQTRGGSQTSTNVEMYSIHTMAFYTEIKIKPTDRHIQERESTSRSLVEQKRTDHNRYTLHNVFIWSSEINPPRYNLESWLVLGDPGRGTGRHSRALEIFRVE